MSIGKVIKTYGAKSSDSLFAYVCLNALNSLYDEVYPKVKLFIVYQQWIVDVALHRVLRREGLAGQIAKLACKLNAFAAAASGRLADKSLIWAFTHKNFQIFCLIWQQKTLRQKAELLLIEAL